MVRIKKYIVRWLYLNSNAHKYPQNVTAHIAEKRKTLSKSCFFVFFFVIIERNTFNHIT